MHLLGGIRMMMVRMITRATRHCEVRATCFPEGGVPTGYTFPFSSITHKHNVQNKFHNDG